jgi:hypothetical protein
MKKDELQEEHSYDASRRRYSEGTGQVIEPEVAEFEHARELERTEEVGRGRTVEEERLLLDEDEARAELPR